MNSTWFRTLLACALVSLFASAPALAQSSSGTVTGRVVDASGAAIAGADVKLINQATKDIRKLTSGADGGFVFSSVPPGAFSLTVQSSGFKLLEKTNLNLAPSERLATGDLRLDVGTVSETVEVTSQGAAIQTESSERSALIDSRQISTGVGPSMASGSQMYSGICADLPVAPARSRRAAAVNAPAPADSTGIAAAPLNTDAKSSEPNWRKSMNKPSRKPTSPMRFTQNALFPASVAVFFRNQKPMSR